MARTCTICTHTDRDDLDLAIISGQSHPTVAASFRVTHDSVRRHAANHLEPRLIEAATRRRLFHDDDLLGRMLGLVEEAEDALTRAKAGDDSKGVLSAIREVRESLKAASALMPSPEDEDVEILVKALGHVLPQFPEAAQALALELGNLGDYESAKVVAAAIAST